MKILFFLIFLYYSHLAAGSHYCSWLFKLDDRNILFPKCDVEKDFQKIYNDTKCSNLVAIDGTYSYAITKSYLEIINNTLIKKWDITNSSKSFIQFSVNNQTICKIVLTYSSYDRLEFIFENNLGAYYATFNHYKKKADEKFLTNDFPAVVGISSDYVFIFSFINDTLKEKLFSKKEKTITHYYDLKKYNQSIIDIRKSFSLFPNLYKEKGISVFLEDGTMDTVYPKYPPVQTYKYQYESSNSYGGSSTVIWIPIGFFFVILKCCACYYCKQQRDEDGGGLERTSTFRPECRPPPAATHGYSNPSFPGGIPQNEFENLLNSRNWNEAIPMPWKQPQNSNQ